MALLSREGCSDVQLRDMSAAAASPPCHGAVPWPVVAGDSGLCCAAAVTVLAQTLCDGCIPKSHLQLQDSRAGADGGSQCFPPAHHP